LEKKVLYRVDGGHGVGNGHLMRTLALAQCLKGRGWTQTLITSRETPVLASWKKEGVNIIYNDELPGSMQDVRYTNDVIDITNPKCVILDGYSFTVEYQEALSCEKCLLLCLDDTENTSVLADIVLNQNPGAEFRYVNSYPQVRQKLLGSSYTLLRREFWSHKSRAKSKSSNKVLVTFGGDDKDNLALSATLSLLREGGDFTIQAIITSSEEGFSSAKELASKYPDKVQVTRPTDIVPLYLESDILLTAGGTTVLEAAFFGVPSVVITTAPNQEPGIKSLQKLGCVIYAGQGEKFLKRACSQVLMLLASNMRLNKMAEQCQAVIDGYGVRRVADAIEFAEVKV